MIFLHEKQLIQLRLLRAEQNHLHPDLLEQGHIGQRLRGKALEAAHGGGAYLVLHLFHAAEYCEDGAGGAAERIPQLFRGERFDALLGDDLQRGLNDLVLCEFRLRRHGEALLL